MPTSTKLVPSLEHAAHAIAVGLAGSIAEAARQTGFAQGTLYNALAKDVRIREAFQTRIEQHREKRADKSARLLKRSEDLAERSLIAADNTRALDPVTGLQCAAMGVKVAAEIRAQLGDTASSEPAAESIDALASRIRRAVIRSLACALANPARGEQVMRGLMKLETRRQMNTP